MPLYEYQCQKCGKRFERIQKYSDPPPSACPSCGGAVDKLFSSPAFQFKGAGWYVTDYARKSDGGSEKVAAKGDTPESGSSTGAASADKSDKPDKPGNADKADNPDKKASTETKPS
jgi:putative FmdB family regulatory protein